LEGAGLLAWASGGAGLLSSVVCMLVVIFATHENRSRSTVCLRPVHDGEAAWLLKNVAKAASDEDSNREDIVVLLVVYPLCELCGGRKSDKCRILSDIFCSPPMFRCAVNATGSNHSSTPSFALSHHMMSTNWPHQRAQGHRTAPWCRWTLVVPCC
jgi:hypothetical protein